MYASITFHWELSTVRILLLGLLWALLSPCALAGDDEKAAGPVLEYLEMTPKFTVNLNERKKYLLVNVQLLVEDQANIDKIKKHMPALRHELIMLFSGHSADDLKTTEQREELRKQALDRIRMVLDKYANSDGFRDVFFTEFLVH